MKLIKPYFEIIEQDPGLEGIYKQIERAGRTCYHSSDKITEDSAKKFVDMLIKRGHTSCLEHGTIYLKIPIKAETFYEIDEYKNNPYTKTTIARDLSCYYISTNYRVLVEHNWLDDLKYLCEPTEYHERRVTVRFICDRGVSHEFVRHRVFSFAQESTRYCNYSKDKFGNELTFIIPCWLHLKEGWYGYQISEKNVTSENPTIDEGYLYSVKPILTERDAAIAEYIQDETSPFISSLTQSEVDYFRLLNNGWIPQQARAVLPNALKTELVMTGFISDWKCFFDLRATEAGAKGPHPQASELANPLYKEFLKRNYI